MTLQIAVNFYARTDNWHASEKEEMWEGRKKDCHFMFHHSAMLNFKSVLKVYLKCFIFMKK